MSNYKPYQGTNFDLDGKVAIVTGAAGILGGVFVKSLLSAGAEVIAVDLNLDNLLIEDKYSSKIHLCIVDITNEVSVNNFIKKISKFIIKIDILVNSAAIDPKFDKESNKDGFTKFTDFPLDQWNQSIDVNLTGVFIMTKAVCGVMEKTGEGSIINLGSNYGLIGPDQRIYKKKGEDSQSYKPAIYSVCKSAIIGFTKYLASYYSDTKIRVNTLTPAGVYNNQDDEFVDNYSSRTILRRMSNKEEYASAILFLSSDASSYMTGSNLIIDGGWTAL
jgi:NAD(P)-dependent dehydrogenase (short-subunit alcohol dehydrogenase family)